MKINLPEVGSFTSKGVHWFNRLGLAGFSFFFIKGMLWLLIPWLAHSALF